MVKKIAFLAVCATILASCAPSGQRAVARLGDTPTVSGGEYSSGGGISVAADIRNSNGSMLVCGVWAQSRAQSILTKGKASRVVSHGSIFLGQERIVQNFLFMNEVAPAPSYAGQEAGCLLLDRAWTEADANRPLLIRIPRQIVARENLEFGGGLTVVFTDTGRPEAGTQ